MDQGELEAQSVITFNWKDHGRTLVQGLQEMFQRSCQVNTEVTFDGEPQVKVHRLVLSVFLQSSLILGSVVDFNDVAESADDVRSLVQFVYTGRLTVRKDQIESLRRLAEKLNFEGLAKTIDDQTPLDKNAASPIVAEHPLDICDAVIVSDNVDVNDDEPDDEQRCDSVHIDDDDDDEWPTSAPLDNDEAVESPSIDISDFELNDYDRSDEVIFDLDAFSADQPVPDVPAVDRDIAFDDYHQPEVDDFTLNDRAYQDRPEVVIRIEKLESLSNQQVKKKLHPGRPRRRRKKWKSFACNKCSKVFTTGGSLRRHTESVHDNLKPFACDHCSKRFGRKYHMKRHTLFVHENGQVHNDDVMPVDKSKKKKSGRPRLSSSGNVCEYCDKGFSAVGSLRRHIRTIHEHGAFFHCEKCPLVFPESRFLKQHYQNKHKTRQPDGQLQLRKCLGRRRTYGRVAISDNERPTSSQV